MIGSYGTVSFFVHAHDTHGLDLGFVQSPDWCHVLVQKCLMEHWSYKSLSQNGIRFRV